MKNENRVGFGDVLICATLLMLAMKWTGIIAVSWLALYNFSIFALIYLAVYFTIELAIALIDSAIEKRDK